jgi:uncharacterized protein YndB with AHSA1/START domain
MITTEATETIARPPPEVFAFVSDPSNEPKWHTDVIEARFEPEGSAAAGKVLHGVFKAMGRRTAVADVSAFEQDRRIQYRFRGSVMGLRATVTLELDPTEAGTRFTRRLEIQPLGLMRILAPLMRSSIARSNAGFVRNLKRLLETGSATS